MKTFVYCITNTVNRKVYFGKTVDVATRWYKHCWDADHGKDYPLHRAIRKYGGEAFEVETLAEYPSNRGACEHETRLIATVEDPSQCYNVASGGDGGHTLTQAQLEKQRAIPEAEYPKFLELFHQGASRVAIMAFFDTSYSSVGRCAERVGVSFLERRRQRGWHAGKKAKKPGPRVEPSRATMTPEERSAFRAEVARRSNKARGASSEIQQRIRALYFEQDMTAQEVATSLGVSKGSVRGTINRAYAAMPPEERSVWKKRHGSRVRQGERNANYQGA